MCLMLECLCYSKLFKDSNQVDGFVQDVLERNCFDALEKVGYNCGYYCVNFTNLIFVLTTIVLSYF